ncbi:hypothetical protein OR626_23925 [Pseudomonas sp. S1Bt30]|uniref:Uncharacterized protein n=1 Tax=Pseudomonas quebecensis TaxID=2995174 RepID=A0ABY6QME0_9PSED|nr:hypothetical protein [Pseudomonas quebecensis]MCX4067265.1 hypothetical protein [Pseudomonas quebecensis]UZW21149.1 hypothetical protein OSC50_12675 [Pseudomonas quebecensis]UZW21433.1 hypothetical protein OSC48_12805 [Pseudomonas quebecensis]UZW26492.1 hypothetical protein OSC49_12810 [Pseudomonas quebecensis]
MYVSNHLSLVEEQRQHVDSIAERTAQFLAAGGTIYQGKSPSINPPPPHRSTKIDPETILKRRKPPITAAERKVLRKLAEAL